MDFLQKIAKALGLEDADEDKVLEALAGRVALADLAEALEVEIKADELTAEKLVEDVKAKVAESNDEASLEDRAKQEGKVVVDAADYAEVKRNATRGLKASEELHQSKFDTAFDKALEDLRVDAKDETRERFQKLYDADAGATLELLDGLPKLASTEARGKTGKVADTPEGVDADRAELDRKAKAYMREHKDATYLEALDAVVEAEEEI